MGEGAPDALRAAAAADPADTVATYDEVLTRLRTAPLPAALVHLAVAASLLLVLLAGLGVVLGAALDAPARATALGRLRSLGLADRELRRVLAGELLVPVLASVLTGLVVGVATALRPSACSGSTRSRVRARTRASSCRCGRGSPCSRCR